jgi:hypothetical protein
MLGFAAIPALRYYAFAPLLLDLGTGFALVFGLPPLLRACEKIGKKGLN